MKKKEIILTPIMPIGELFKKFVEDKAIIQEALRQGKTHELKDRYKFVTTV
jgi:hypothetical protein